jgi:hypothetical protein
MPFCDRVKTAYNGISRDKVLLSLRQISVFQMHSGAPVLFVCNNITQCCQRQFTWRLYFVDVISSRLGLCNGTAQQVLTDQKTFCAAVFAPLHVNTCLYGAYRGEMLIWTVVLSRACAERVILTYRPIIQITSLIYVHCY